MNVAVPSPCETEPYNDKTYQYKGISYTLPLVVGCVAGGVVGSFVDGITNALLESNHTTPSLLHSRKH